ncbi:hypothetical protein [Hyphomonas sp.]|uniref:hypothetical protein n=1 Tax=Hyphomonas sp. TaxID=87 RepID=UPI00391BCF36
MARLLAFLILLTGIAQPLAGALAPAFGIGTPIGAATSGQDMPDQPLPAFFSIWSVIFAAYIAFGAAALIRPPAWLTRFGLPLLAAGLLNILWMLTAQLVVYQPLDFLILFPILAASWTAARIAARINAGGERSLAFRFAEAASGLLSGWISVATAISVPLTIRSLTTIGPTDHAWPMVWTTLLTAGALGVLYTRFISPALWFFAAAGWGLLGIAMHNWLETGMHLIGHVAAGYLVLLLVWRLTRGANLAKPA